MLYERLKKQINDNPPRVVTFDFFDTLCLRRTENPPAVFFHVAEELKNRGLLHRSFSSERFVSLRAQAEARARNAKLAEAGNPEVSLREIYLQLGKFSAFDRRALADVIAIEEAVELQGLFLYDRAIEMLEFARKKGLVTAVVSDSYFSRGFFERIFDANGVEPPRHLFVSNEVGVGKGSGLWNLVPGRLGVAPHEILHIGDNYGADVEVPAKAGVRTFFVAHGNSQLFDLIGKERKFLQAPTARYAATSVSTIRAKANIEADMDDRFVAYGYQMLGPIFSYYAAWAAEMSRQIDADFVVPLAREGIFLAKLFDKRQTRLTNPLFVSRRFMRLIDFRNPTREKLDELFATRRPLSQSGMEEYLASLVGDADDSRGDGSDEALSWSERTAFLDELWADKDRLNPLIEKARSQAERFTKHLRNIIGDWDDVQPGKRLKLALIDVGWNASIQRFLARFFEEEDLPITTAGLYIMTTPAADRVSFAHAEAFGFLIDSGAPSAVAELALRNVEIIEQSATPAGVGSLLEFSASGIPSQMDVSVDATQGSQIERIQSGVVAFDRARRRMHHPIAWTTELQDEIRAILLRAMILPTEGEAALFAAWKHDDNIENGAEPITQDIEGLLPFMTPRQFLTIDMAEQYWPFPNLLRAPDLLRKQVLAVLHRQQDAASFETPLGHFDVSLVGEGGRPLRQQTVEAAANLDGRGLLKIFPGSPVERVDLTSRLRDAFVESIHIRLDAVDRESGATLQVDLGSEDLAATLPARVQPGERYSIGVAKVVPPTHNLMRAYVCFETVPASSRMMEWTELQSKTARGLQRAFGWVERLNDEPALPDATGLLRARLKPGQDTLTVSGWLLGAGWSTAGHVILSIEGADGSRQSAQCVRTERPELTDALRRPVPSNGGVFGRINISSIKKKGPFRIALLQIDGPTTSTYVHGHALVIE